MRSTMKRKAAAMAVGTAALLGVSTACSSSGSSAPAPAATGSASGTITWMANQFGPTGGVDVRNTLIAAFEKANPKIKVKLIQAPSDENTYESELVTQISGGSSSFDVYNGDVIWPAQFGKKGLALPLSQYFSQSYWNTFSKGLIPSVTYNGKVYAAPLFTDNAFLFYRKDLLAQAHLPVPATWEQVQSEGQTLQKDGLVKYGFAGQFDSYEGLTCDFTEFAADAGGTTVNAKGTKGTMTSAADTKALTYMRGLISSGVAPAAVTTFQEQQSESLFTSGQDAFLRNWTYAYADSNTPAASKIVGKVGVTNLPTFAGQQGPGYSVTGGWNLYINPHSKHIAADVAFMKWLTGTQAQTIIAKQGGEIPTVASVLQNPSVQAANPAYPIAAKNKLNARPSFVPEYQQVSQAIFSNVNAALSGSVTPAKALSTANTQINAALSNKGL